MKDRYFPIGTMNTCFREKFGTPRQANMISEALGVIKMKPDPVYTLALQHLDRFSHLWILFVFHHHLEKPWRPTIRPPRVDGPRKVGVFASRSPHRPNPIGMSAVKLDWIDLAPSDGVEIHVSGVDILDGTPVLDIKPYLPYADSIPGADAGWAQGEIQKFDVRFSQKALDQIQKMQINRHPRMRELISQMLEWDPRPKSQRKTMPIDDPKTQGFVFGFRIFDFDVQWQINEKAILVLELLPIESTHP